MRAMSVWPDFGVINEKSVSWSRLYFRGKDKEWFMVQEKRKTGVSVTELVITVCLLGYCDLIFSDIGQYNV